MLSLLLPFDNYLVYTTANRLLLIFYMYPPPNFHTCTTPPLSPYTRNFFVALLSATDASQTMAAAQ